MAATRLVVALGGNAILRSKTLSSYAEQFDNVRRTCSQIVTLIAEGYQPIFTHGNGPQVGNLLIQNETAAAQVPPVPLDVCGAETQGQIGYMIQQALRNELAAAGLSRPVVSVVTQVLVDADDPAFAQPSKPIGPFLPQEVAEARMRTRARRGPASTHAAGASSCPPPAGRHRRARRHHRPRERGRGGDRVRRRRRAGACAGPTAASRG